jgi:hypothetical protein
MPQPKAVRHLRHLRRPVAMVDDDLEGFWASLWTWFGIDSSYEAVVEGAMRDIRWFPGARLKYAERSLAGEGLAVLAHSQPRRVHLRRAARTGGGGPMPYWPEVTGRHDGRPSGRPSAERARGADRVSQPSMLGPSSAIST